MLAVTELDLTHEKFWSLTWYEWGTYLIKLFRNQQRITAEHEFLMDLTRRFMALFANANRSKNTRVFMPEDFFKLSYDTQLHKNVDPELFSKVARKLGGTIKPKKK